MRIRRSLKSTGLYRHFADHAIFSAAMVQRGKPAPDLFLHAAGEMAAAPAACIVIEDSLPGVEAAVAAGMTVLGFAGASHIRDGHADRLRDRGAAHVFDDMAALPALLEAATR
jgi:beta-phosphoglucomutase-like phosphatase (HAD superfamily)